MLEQTAYRLLAKTYQRRGEMDRAIQIYHDALTVLNGDGYFYNSYAWWVYENKVQTEYQTAIRYTKSALDQKPEAYYICDTLAWLYFESGEQKNALEASAKAMNLAPKNRLDCYEKGWKQIQKGK